MALFHSFTVHIASLLNYSFNNISFHQNNKEDNYFCTFTKYFETWKIISNFIQKF